MNIFTARKYEEKIRSIITVSNELSIPRIASIANLSEEETTKIIEKMISKSSTGNINYKAFRNAHINHHESIVVIDETKSNGFVEKFGKMTNSLLDKFTPKIVEEKTDWKCVYCASMNAGEAYFCTQCGGKKEQ